MWLVAQKNEKGRLRDRVTTFQRGYKRLLALRAVWPLRTRLRASKVTGSSNSERPGGEANLALDISDWSVGRVNWLVCPVIGRMGLLSSLLSPLWVGFKSHRFVRFRPGGEANLSLDISEW
jgi:hypothetical protein